MGSEAKKLLEQVLRLPEDERALVIASLIESMDGAASNDVDAAWDAEIAHRIAEFEAGVAKPIPWAEARKRLLADL